MYTEVGDELKGDGGQSVIATEASVDFFCDLHGLGLGLGLGRGLGCGLGCGLGRGRGKLKDFLRGAPGAFAQWVLVLDF